MGVEGIGKKGRERKKGSRGEGRRGEERRKKRKGYVRRRRSTYQWKNILLAQQIVLQQVTYISSVHVVLEGFSSHCPASKNLTREKGSTPGYGVRPRLNISQHVTPNDH